MCVLFHYFKFNLYIFYILAIKNRRDFDIEVLLGGGRDSRVV